MITDLFLALRFLREGRSQTVLIALGVGLGSAVVVFLTGLLSGLQASLIERTLGSQAHVVIRPESDAPRPLRADTATELIVRSLVEAEQRPRSISGWRSLVRQMQTRDGVAALAPVATGPGMVIRGNATRAVVIMAAAPDALERVIPIERHLREGRGVGGGGEVLLGVDLADDLGARVGDVVRIRGSAGLEQRLVVAGTFDLGSRAVNERWAVMPLRVGQSMLSLSGQVSDILVRIDDVFEADQVADRIAADTGLVADSWMRTNQQLMVGLKGQSNSGNLIAVFVVIAVAMGISSVLVVSVVQKSGEIGILRAAGASRGFVMRVFLWQGAILGLFGALAGCGLGYGLGRLFESLGANPDGTPQFPVAQPPSLFVATIVGAVFVGLVAAVWPARRAARLDPVVAIRNA